MQRRNVRLRNVPRRSRREQPADHRMTNGDMSEVAHRLVVVGAGAARPRGIVSFPGRAAFGTKRGRLSRFAAGCVSWMQHPE
jgi:hypothetical protein